MRVLIDLTPAERETIRERFLAEQSKLGLSCAQIAYRARLPEHAIRDYRRDGCFSEDRLRALLRAFPHLGANLPGVIILP